MATTENGTYYPSDYSSIADVPEDMKKLAESVDANKVQKIQGKGLSTNDFTNELKRKLEGLNNYDDTDIKRDISVIKEEQQKQNENIENLQTDNEINKSDIASLKAEITELEEDVKANGITEETEEAKSLYIPNASGSRGKIIVMGNVEQETSETGVNKFSLGEDKQTQIGLEVTLDKSRVVVNGTSTSSGYLWNYNDNESTALKFIGRFKAGTYKWFHIYNSGNFSGEGAFAFYIRNESASALATLTNTDSSKTVRTITLEEDTNLYVNGFVNSANMVFNNFEILFQLQDGSIETTDYEEFIPNMPSPNYPSLVKCLGNNKNQLYMEEKETTQIGVVVKQNESSLICNGTTSSSGNLLDKGYVNIGNFKAGKYRFKIHTSGTFEKTTESDFAFYIREKDNILNSYGVITATNLKNEINWFAFELETDKDLVIQIFVNSSGIIFENFEMKLKIEEGEISTSYSPYGQGSTAINIKDSNQTQQKSYILNIQQEMLEGDYFIKETDGWKEVHNWNGVLLNGTEDWKNNFGGQELFGLENFVNSMSSTKRKGYCESYKYNSVQSGLYGAMKDGEFALQTVNNVNNIYFKDLRFTNATDFKAELASNNIAIYYPLETPTKLPCTQAQIEVLEQLNKLRFYKGINNIITTENIALLKAEYSVDIKSYIESLTTNEEG